MAKHRPVQVLIKPASADCNLNCGYCFYLRKASLYPDAKVHRMAPDVQEEMIRQILLYGGDHPAFAYQGGEPTLMGLDYFKRSVEIQMERAARGTTISNSIQTNGILIDDHWAAFLAQYRFLVGLSLDGPAHVHDSYRIDRGGNPTHERVLGAARLMRDYGVEFNILSVISSYAAPRAKEIYHYHREQGFDWLQFIPAVEFDPATGKLADFSPAPDDYGRFMCDIFDEWKAEFKNGRPTVSVRLFDTLLSIYAGLGAPSCTFRHKCGIYLVVEHNGDCYACDFFVDPEWKLGNLMEQSMRAMLEGPRMREFADMKADLHPDCEACEWLRICHGGCTKDRMRSGAPGERGKDYFCESYKRIFEHTDATFRELAEIVRQERRQQKPAPKTGAAAKRKRKKR